MLKILFFLLVIIFTRFILRYILNTKNNILLFTMCVPHSAFTTSCDVTERQFVYLTAKISGLNNSKINYINFISLISHILIVIGNIILWLIFCTLLIFMDSLLFLINFKKIFYRHIPVLKHHKMLPKFIYNFISTTSLTSTPMVFILLKYKKIFKFFKVYEYDYYFSQTIDSYFLCDNLLNTKLTIHKTILFKKLPALSICTFVLILHNFICFLQWL